MTAPLPVFSVIIPAYNEEAWIGECLDALRAQDAGVETIVVDGGSTDDTVEIAAARGVRVLRVRRGRGHQCNEGARVATGDVLVFLHADTRLPAGAFAELAERFSDLGTKIGVFRLRIDVDHWIMRFYGWCNRFDSVLTRFSDQGIVVRKDLFCQIGGFPDWRLFDDTEFLKRARRQARVVLFSGMVTTSGRRFRENGVVRQYFRDAFLMLQYLCGASPEYLAGRYARMGTGRKKGGASGRAE